ncbi:sugar MFS transporter [Oleiagrimonas soli]|uniref:FHS family L-fucose permease-like MFS transporter n=1 Tax=Oleiagrimonas soli TaxID=1543381 RepID=A0A099CW10_9GAMM|nr:sugar MFS transporter [Oleiagrimonas soli]KGI78133.1 major facilitator transporter [Oleiagrimonas soli]MBB6183421.1 FHS family L-fucose permease-like MFS transporter [Oleiagrimonas soli]
MASFSPAPTSAPSGAPGDKRYTYFPAALTVLTLVFFMWGFLTALNDSLIPHLKAAFELSYTKVMLVQFTFFGTYFLMSLPSGWLVERLGFKLGIVTGLGIAGVGALGFLPAAQWHNYPVFLGALFVLASGITVLQVAANPYVTLLGPARTGSSRLTLAQTLNSLGTTLAPIFGGYLILSHAVKKASEVATMSATDQLLYRSEQAQSVQMPYLGLAAALFLLAGFVWLFHLPTLSDNTGQTSSSKQALRETLRGLGEALRIPHVAFGVLAIFFYVGAEVSIGSFMINYISRPDIGNISEQTASHYVSFYWGGAMVGRFFGSFLLAWINPRKMLSFFAIVAGALLVTTMLTHGDVAMISVIAIGLFNSIMFPTIFALGIERLGPLTDKASSLLIMAIVGGALVPLGQGFLADRFGLQISFVLPLVCYVYILFYGLRGSRIRQVPETATPAP